jgi:hypothetical protein
MPTPEELMTDTAGETPAEPSRFPELDELQREIARRIRDNQRFLDHFLDEDFVEETEEEDGDGTEDFEVL